MKNKHHGESHRHYVEQKKRKGVHSVFFQLSEVQGQAKLPGSDRGWNDG